MNGTDAVAGVIRHLSDQCRTVGRILAGGLTDLPPTPKGTPLSSFDPEANRNLNVWAGYAVASHIQDRRSHLPIVVAANHREAQVPENASNTGERPNPKHARHHSQHGKAWTYWLCATDNGIYVGAYGAPSATPTERPAQIREPLFVPYEYAAHTDPAAIVTAAYIERVIEALGQMQRHVVHAHQALADAEDEHLLGAILAADTAAL